MTEEVSAGRLSMEAYVDTTGVTRGLQAKIDREVSRIRARIKAEINTRGTITAARKAAEEASRAATVRLKVELDTRGLIGQARAAAQQASAAAVVRVRAEIEQTSMAQVRAEIDQAAQGQQVHVDVEADTSGAVAETEAAKAAMSRPVNVPVRADTSAATQGMNLLSNSAGTAVMQLSKFPAMAGGIFMLGTAAVQAGGGLVAMASAASQAVYALAAIPNLVGIAVQGIGALIVGFNGIGDAVGAMGKAQEAAGASTATLAGQQEAAADQIANAQRALADARHQAADAARQSAEAISDAEWALARAQEAARDAQEGLNEARKEARERIRDLNRELALTAGEEESAMAALEKAREDLQDVNWDAASSEQERRDAEMAVREAELALQRQQEQTRDLRRETKEANREGVEGSDQVKDAKDRVRDTAHAEQEAEEALAEARHQAADSARQSAQAIADAQRALAAAHRGAGEAATAQTAAMTNLATAMDNLSPAGRRFAEFIYGLKPRWIEFRNAVQSALLPPIQEGITRAMPLLDTLQTGMVNTAKRIGNFAKRLGTLFGSKTFNNDVGKIMGSNNRALGDFLASLRNMIAVMARVARVAGPTLVEPFAEWTRQLTRGWRQTLKTRDGMQNLRDKMEAGRETVAQLWRILRNLTSALGGLGEAATPTGESLLDTFESVTKAWSDFANSEDGQERMQKFFEATEPVTEALGDFIAQLTELIIKLSEAGGGPLIGVLTALTGIVNAVNALLEVPGAGPAIGWLLTLAGVAGGLGMAAGMVLKMARNIGKLGGAARGAGGLFKRLTGGISGAKDAIDDELPKDEAKKEALDSLGDSADKSGKSLGGRLVAGVKKATRAVADGAKRAATAVGTWSRNTAAAAKNMAKTAWTKFAAGARAAGTALLSASRAALAWVGSMLRSAAATAANTARMVAARLAALAHRAATLLQAAATAVVTAAQRAMNIVMMMNPIGLVIAAIVALIAIFVILYKKNETVRKAIDRAWAAIKKAIVWAWQRAIKPALTAVWKALQTLGKWAKWLWNNAIKPAWRAISDAVQTAWKRYYKPILSALWGGLKTLGKWFSWLWDRAIKPAWNAIKGAIENAWKRAIKPVFDTLIRVVKKDIPAAFTAAKNAIKTVWDKIKGIASAPIEFVVNTVYNDGIRKVVNAIPGVPDLPSLSFRGAATGGITGRGRLASILPGYTPGRDVHQFVNPRTGQGLELSGGEAIMRPEWTRAIGERGVNLMNALARKGGNALRQAVGAGAMPHGMHHAAGGVVRGIQTGVNTLRYFLGGVLPLQGGAATNVHDLPYYGTGASWAGDLNGPYDLSSPPGGVYAWKSGTIGHSFTGYGDSHGRYGNHLVVNHDSGGSSWYAHLSSIIKSAGRVAAGEMIGRVGATGNADGAHLHFEVRGTKTTGGTTGPSGPSREQKRDYKEDKAKWWDVIGVVKNFAGNVRGWWDKFSGGGWWSMAGDMVRKVGKGVQGYINDKVPDKIKVPLFPDINLPDDPLSVFDTGGQWRSGTLGVNLSGQTETVFTNREMVDLSANLAALGRALHGMVAEPGGTTGSSALVDELHLHATPPQFPSLLRDATYELTKINQGGVHARRPS